MKTIAWSQNLTPSQAATVGVEAVSSDVLFRRSDVVTMHLRLSDRTRALVGQHEIAKMNRVRTSSTPRARRSSSRPHSTRRSRKGRIAGAALDVYAEEPLPPDHPVRRLPNTVLTPHLGYVTRQQYKVFFEQVLEDIHAYLTGSPVRVIEPE